MRDLYLFSVYTGLAYHEAFALQKKHVIMAFDKKLWIEMKREKTGKAISVPLLPQAIQIIKKYDNGGDREAHVLPAISNQKINSYLKEIVEIVGINKKLTHHTARKTFATTILLYNVCQWRWLVNAGTFIYGCPHKNTMPRWTTRK